MPARTLPNLGLQAFFDLGEDGWKDEMDTNVLKLSVLVQGHVDSIEAALPGAPAEGDIVILDEAHGTNPNEIAVYDAAAWVYIVPAEGWMMYNLDDSTLYQFNGATWEAFASGGGSGALTVKSEAGTAYTAVLADANKYIRFTNAAAIDFTIPAEASVNFPVNTVIAIEQADTGVVTLVEDTGVTLNSRGALLNTAGQFAVVQVKKVAADEWTVIGDVA